MWLSSKRDDCLFGDNKSVDLLWFQLRNDDLLTFRLLTEFFAQQLHLCWNVSTGCREELCSCALACKLTVRLTYVHVVTSGMNENETERCQRDHLRCVGEPALGRRGIRNR